MQYGTERKIGEIKDFKGLVQYLRDDLDWPLDVDEIEDLTFEYEADELGLKSELAVKVKEIKQLRPVVDRQPWGIFWVEFENRALPITVMRQILRALVYKKRATAKAADRKAWHLKDLMFMSSLGEKGNRRINFSYFRETGEGEPTLQTFFWDEQETQFYWLERNHLERLRWPAEMGDIESWRQQWASAFTAGYREPVRTAKELSERLAALAANTRDAVLDVLKYESSEGPLHRLLESFQTVLLHDLDEGGFADMIAQTIAYGLFSARCTGQEVLGLAHLEAMVPNTNRFLKELFAELAKISGHKKGQINFDDLGLSEMVELLRDKNIEAVLEEFGRQAGGGKEDPVIHFYETFLNVYDKQQKVQRGVFYTPKPVVSFIVRSVHEVLQKEFGLVDGLADVTTWGEMAQRVPGLPIPKEAKGSDPFVQILDPATGTGTFLEEVVEVVHATMMARWRKEGRSLSAVREAWNDYVPKHLLPRLRGFELMMAPYAVAHMKIGLKLRQTGYDFRSNERLRVYLTNTLEPPEKGNRKLGFLPDFLSHESMQADAVKEHKAITIVIGNPPYAGVSANLQPLMRRMVDPYRRVDEQPIVEKSALQFEKNLNDDYVKFLRYAESLIERRVGVVGYITNNGYLESVTLRGLRSHLLDKFQSLRFVDLHGDADKREVADDGSPDVNVFDIKHGVAIAVLSRTDPVSRSKGSAWRCDLRGERDLKYEFLKQNNVYSAVFQECHPKFDRYFFRSTDSALEDEYQAGFSVADLFDINSTGFESGRDEILVHFTKSELDHQIRDFCTLDAKTVRDKFSVDAGWGQTLFGKRSSIIKDPGYSHRFLPFLFNPFDIRYCFYRKDVLKTNSFSAGKHLCYGENLCLVVMRQVSLDAEYSHCAVSRLIPNNRCFYSTKGKVSYFPLYIYSGESDLVKQKGVWLGVNFKDSTWQRVSKAFCLKPLPRGCGDLETTVGPEDLMHYIVALMASREYRRRYSVFLRTDFPRVPFFNDLGLIRKLCAFGAEIAALQILDQNGAGGPYPSRTSGSTYEGAARPVIEAGYPRYERGRVWIGESACFTRVQQAVWEAQVGGYQPCQKWLKDRRGRRLSEPDIEHYVSMVNSLGRVGNLSGQIDELIEEKGGYSALICTTG